jgi:hypothetical protein
MAQRIDFYIRNDSGGMSVVSGAALQRIIDDERGDDEAFVRNHEAILLMLHGDDSFAARVVIGGELTQAERDEWLARVTWPLELDDGQLIVAGGFDPRVFEGWRAGEDWCENAAHAVTVGRGKYIVDLYTYRLTISGRFLDERWPTPLGKWFRSSYPGEPFPRWMVGELELSPELDPGHEKEWADVDAAIEAGTLHVDEDAWNAIGYLVHVRPFRADARTSGFPDGGWFEPEEGERTPPVCPRGVITDARDEAEPDSETVIEPTADVSDVAGRGVLPRLDGEPVQLPLAHLDQLFIIAWMMEPLSHPEVRVFAPAAQPPAVDAGYHQRAMTARRGCIACRSMGRRSATGCPWASSPPRSPRSMPSPPSSSRVRAPRTRASMKQLTLSKAPARCA